MLPELFKQARETSYNSDHYEFKVGAAIFKQGKLLSHACNTSKSHPKMIRFGNYVTSHAEFNAVSKIKNKDILKGTTIVVYREDKNGEIAMSKPCEMCGPMLKSYGIKKVIYTTRDGFEEFYL